MSTPAIISSIIGYLLVACFVMGFFWRKWNCKPTYMLDTEFGIFAIGIFWIVTFPAWLAWSAGHWFYKNMVGC